MSGWGALSPEDLERFETRSRVEIVARLRELVERRAAVSVHFGGGGDFIVSSLLAVNPEFEELVFDASGDEDANRRIVRAGKLLFVSVLDRIRIQFGAGRAGTTSHEGLPALRARIPEALLRLQRRDHFRVAPPLARPLACRLPDPREPGRTLELRILDISCGGIAVADGPRRLALETGMLLEDCSLDLPGAGTLAFRAAVRSVSPRGAPGGAPRYGLAFIDIPPAAIARIQRYILQLDREKLR